jgi:2-oxoglutarate dehydrogenase E2 component (dihydrolipoamide succinyltransferase)
MATKVEMPQMGESVVEGTILTWLKKEGDPVSVDDPLVEVSTDKVDTEIPSPVAGTLTKILVQEGETVEIGTPLCEVDESGSGAGAAPAETQPEQPEQKDAPAETPEEQTEQKPPVEEVREKTEEVEDEKVAAEAPPESAPKKAPEPARAPAKAEEKPAASAAPAKTEEAGEPQVLSPLVRRLAREHNVDLTKVRGTGASGRVTREDVMAFVEQGGAAAPAVDGQRAAAPVPAAAAVAERAAPPPVRESGGDGRTEAMPVTRIRKLIAEHMVASLATSARAWNAIEVDMEEIAKLRAKVGGDFKSREGFSLTYLPFISRAVCDALQAFPVVNASLSEDLSEATYHNYVNLGIAVATDYGLIVPVIKGAEALNVVGLARAIRDLGERARDKKLNPDDVGGSTFSITNPGPFGSYLSLPVINQPNVAILSTEVVEKRVVVVEDMIGIRHRTFMSMSWDHRLLDGADAMRFLQRLKENLETWDFSHEV